MTNPIAQPIGRKQNENSTQTASEASAHQAVHTSAEGPLSIEQICDLYQTAWRNDRPIALVMGLQTAGGYRAHDIKAATRGCLGLTDYEIPASKFNGGTPAMRFAASPAMQRFLALWPKGDPDAQLLPIHIESYRLRLRYIAQDAGLPNVATIKLRRLFAFAGPWYGDQIPNSKVLLTEGNGNQPPAPWSVRIHNLTLDQIVGVELTPSMIPPLSEFPPYMEARRVRKAK